MLLRALSSHASVGLTWAARAAGKRPVSVGAGGRRRWRAARARLLDVEGRPGRDRRAGAGGARGRGAGGRGPALPLPPSFPAASARPRTLRALRSDRGAGHESATARVKECCPARTVTFISGAPRDLSVAFSSAAAAAAKQEGRAARLRRRRGGGRGFGGWGVDVRRRRRCPEPGARPDPPQSARPALQPPRAPPSTRRLPLAPAAASAVSPVQGRRRASR